MRIFYARKTGRGMCCSMYGKGRSTHSIKRPMMHGGELLLSPGLGASEGMRNGNGMPSLQQVDAQKPQMNNVIRRLEQIEINPRRKNIRFQI